MESDANAKMIVKRNSTRRLVFLSVFFILMYLVHAFVYLATVRVYGIEIPYSSIVLAFFAFFYMIASMLVRKYDGRLVDSFYFLAATWLGVIFLAFSLTILYEIIGLFIIGESILIHSILSGVLLVSVILGLIHGSRLVVKEVEIPIEGLEREVTLVHLSDVHIGTVHKKDYLEKIVSISNDHNPDLVLMTGDLFDGSEPIHEDMLRPLDNLNAPTYFSMGNHEEYEGLANVRSTIANLDMKLLDSEKVDQSGLQIIGVNDRQSLPPEQKLKDVLNGISYDENRPTILMYHTPIEWSDARKKGIDLMLSGHTHNGQIYPFNWIVRTSFKHINGLYEEDGKHLHVSPGTGTWGPPMRLGSRNQISVLKLVCGKEKMA